MRSPLLDLLSPPRCLACGARGRQPWCARCAAAVRRLELPQGACDRCGAAPTTHHRCWPEELGITRTVVACRYEGPVAAAVVAAKEAGAASAWHHLARMLARRCSALADADVVTWVTADARRRRRRGFDHAQVLATAVAERLHLPLRRCLEPPRRGRDRGAARGRGRREARAPAFRATRRLEGAAVVLVDDVLTTGGTLAAAVGALRGAGAGRVDLAVLARAGDHPLSANGRPRPG